MERTKLLEYLSIIIDLEKNKYTQEETIKSINNNIHSYKFEFNDNIRCIDNANTSSLNDTKPNKKGKSIKYFLIYYLGCLGCGIGVAAYNLTHITSISVIFGIIGCAVGVCIAALIWGYISKKRQTEAKILAERSLRAEKELNLSRRARNAELNTVISNLKAEQQSLQKTYRLTCETLKKCYGVNIIPVKYRELIPVCMFYDYILNGRTYSLVKDPNSFDEGAINMYEQEVFKQLIISKFDVLIDNMEAIKQNQKVLCNVIQDGMNKTHRMLGEINDNITQVNNNLKTIQYQNEQRNKCVEYMSYVAYQRYMS